MLDMALRDWQQLARALGISLEELMSKPGIEVLRLTTQAIQARPGRRSVSEKLS